MTARDLSRRRFLAGCIGGVSAGLTELHARQRERTGPPRRPQVEPRQHLEAARAHLGARFRDLPRHFVFEYYPWYGTDPWRHWNDAGRTPPGEIAANYLPHLGPYDSRASRVVEQHARWIAESGAAAVNLSWWGQGSYEDRAVPLVMDVMRDHGIHVTFHLEPYAPDRALRLTDDIKYLLREYGDRRRWDGFLLLENADGSSAPVMKMFGSIVPPVSTDCLGVTRPVRDYVPDAVWRQQVSRLRREVSGDFTHFILLADSLDLGRVRAGGFDGGTSFDPYFHPERWPAVTRGFDAADLLFAFAVNAGFDGVRPKVRPDDPCYRPLPVNPFEGVDWASEASRAHAHQTSAERIADAFGRTIQLQIAPTSANRKRGFFLVYVNSFNEWHEGTQFEPMRSLRDLTAADRATYHNPVDGAYRLNAIRELMASVL